MKPTAASLVHMLWRRRSRGEATCRSSAEKQKWAIWPYLQACQSRIPAGFQWDSGRIPGGFRRIPWDSTGVYTDSGVFQCVKREGFSTFQPGGILCYIILKNPHPKMVPAPSPGAVQECSKILPWSCTTVLLGIHSKALQPQGTSARPVPPTPCLPPALRPQVLQLPSTCGRPVPLTPPCPPPNQLPCPTWLLLTPPVLSFRAPPHFSIPKV